MNAEAVSKDQSRTARTAPGQRTQHPDLENHRDQAAVSGADQNEQRISRNGRGQRLSRSATGVPGRAP
jgi:hypothetical protein